MTPRQFEALYQRHLVAQEMGEFMLAQLNAWLVNVNLTSEAKRLEPKDFMPSYWRKQAAAYERNGKPKTIDELIDKVDRIFGSHGEA